MTTCPCGIARVDCEYHRPEPEPAHDDEWIACHTVRLASDCGEYVQTWLHGKLVDEEPAEAYKDHTIEAMVQSYKSIRCEPAEAYHFQNSMGCVVSFSSHDKAMSWLSSQPFPLEWRCSVSVKR